MIVFIVITNFSYQVFTLYLCMLMAMKRKQVHSKYNQISQKGSNCVKFRKKEVTAFFSQIFLCQVGFITLLEETEQDFSQVTF